MRKTKYERVYLLSQHLIRVCEEAHLQMRAKRKEREEWRKKKIASIEPSIEPSIDPKISKGMEKNLTGSPQRPI